MGVFSEAEEILRRAEETIAQAEESFSKYNLEWILFWLNVLESQRERENPQAVAGEYIGALLFSILKSGYYQEYFENKERHRQAEMGIASDILSELNHHDRIQFLEDAEKDNLIEVNSRWSAKILEKKPVIFFSRSRKTEKGIYELLTWRESMKTQTRTRKLRNA